MSKDTDSTPEAFGDLGFPSWYQPPNLDDKSLEVAYQEEVAADGRQIFKCVRCAKTFSHRGMMNRHQLVHTGGVGGARESNKCDKCGRTFLYKSSLHRHIERNHVNKLAFPCKICGRKFQYPSSLEYHLLVHSDVRPHECPTCGKRCRTKHKLGQHMKVHAPAGNPTGKIRCERGCGMEFSSIAACLKHYSEHPNCSANQIHFADLNLTHDDIINPLQVRTTATLVGPNFITRSTVS